MAAPTRRCTADDLSVDALLVVDALLAVPVEKLIGICGVFRKSAGAYIRLIPVYVFEMLLSCLKLKATVISIALHYHCPDGTFHLCWRHGSRYFLQPAAD
jgi:hypothetical protein